MKRTDFLGDLISWDQPSSKPSTMPTPRWPDSTNSVSDDPGTLQADAGAPVRDLCRKHGFSEASYYLWRSKFGGMRAPVSQRGNAKLPRTLNPGATESGGPSLLEPTATQEAATSSPRLRLDSTSLKRKKN